MSTNASGGKAKNTAYYINCLIVVALMVGVGFLPAPAPMTPMGMRILGIFIGAHDKRMNSIICQKRKIREK